MIANCIIADRLIAGLCQPDDTLLDIGAHIGSVFSAVHGAQPKASIFAVEADPDKAEALRSKFRYAGVFAVAVGDTASQAQFYLTDEAGYNSLVASSGR